MHSLAPWSQSFGFQYFLRWVRVFSLRDGLQLQASPVCFQAAGIIGMHHHTCLVFEISLTFLPGQALNSNPTVSISWAAKITGIHHHAQHTGSDYVAQSCLKLLGSRDSSALTTLLYLFIACVINSTYWSWRCTSEARVLAHDMQALDSTPNTHTKSTYYFVMNLFCQYFCYLNFSIIGFLCDISI
jgi:hypothetical protein